MTHVAQQGYPYWAVLLLAVVAASLFIRICILFHDCTHGSFLPSPSWNTGVGFFRVILTITAFYDWRSSHAGHHLTVGDLDRRGLGDITTLTVEEYLGSSPLKRLACRPYRSPSVMFGVGPAYYFLLRNRRPSKGTHKQDIQSVIITNLAILVIVTLAGFSIGLRNCKGAARSPFAAACNP